MPFKVLSNLRLKAKIGHDFSDSYFTKVSIAKTEGRA